MKIECLVADVTPVGSPDRAECAILGVILGVFRPIQAIFVIRKPQYDVGIRSWVLKGSIGVIQ